MTERAREAAARAIRATPCQNGDTIGTALYCSPILDVDISELDDVCRTIANAAIDAYIAARREEGFVELGPTDRWIKIGEGGATFEWRDGSEFTAHNVSIGAYYETPGAKPVTVYRAMLNAAEQQRTEQT